MQSVALKIKQTFCAGFLGLTVISLSPTSLAVTVEEVPNPRQENGAWVTDMATLAQVGSNPSDSLPNSSANEPDSSTGGWVLWVLIGLGTLIGLSVLLKRIRREGDDEGDGGSGGSRGSSHYGGGNSGSSASSGNCDSIYYGGGYSGGSDTGGYSGGCDSGSSSSSGGCDSGSSSSSGGYSGSCDSGGGGAGGSF